MPPLPLEHLDSRLFDKLDQRLRSIDAVSIARGRQYAAEGRVERLLVETPNAVSAVVRGSMRYGVTFLLLNGVLSSPCSCPAWNASGACKHVAAAIFALREARRSSAGSVDDPVARYLRAIGSVTAEGLADAIGRHAGRAIEMPPDFWRRASEWWTQTRHRTDPPARRFRALVIEWAPKLEAELAKLQAWEPPRRAPRAAGASDFQALIESVAAEARRIHGRTLGSTLPGPFDEGAARFVFAYHPDRRLFQVDERTPMGRGGPRLALELPDRPDSGVRSVSAWPSLWDLFALRGLLLALAERSDPAIVALARDLERPRWERMLDATRVKGDKPTARVEDVDIAFRITQSYEPLTIALTALSRRRTEGRVKAKGWKRIPFERLLDGSLTTSELDRQIAHSAISSVRSRLEALVGLGTAHGFGTMELVARHPRIFAGKSKEPSATEGAPRLAVGTLTMTMAVEPDGSLRPTFEAGGHAISHAAISEAEKSFLGLQQEDGLIVSARIPATLRPWLDAALRFGADFVFPPDATPKVAAQLDPLVTEGAAILPREALGEQLAFAPEAALRVEWTVEGATVEMLVAVRPGAPLIEAGAGPKLYAFEENGRRGFVEREFAAEIALVEETAERIEVPLVWTNNTAVTVDIETSLELARFVEENPLGLSIEVKIGRPPKITPFENTRRNLDIVKESSWFSVRGNIELAGKNVSLGELLEAARLARRFIRVDAGSYVELSAEVHSALLPLATAAALAETRGGDPQSVRVNAAFTEALALGAGSFSERSGVDPKVLLRSLEANRTRVVRPSLGAGTLRPYQREGAAWMLRLAAWAPGCVLADDMGLGKTVQTAAILRARASKGPALVVGPASVCSNWLAELARFAPSLKVRWFNQDRTALDKAMPAGTVVIVSYGMLQRDADLFAKRKWSTLVLDEAHYLKNHVARRTDAVKKIPRDFAIALTGTPLENHLGELWSLMDVVFPGLLGTEAAFRERFRKPIEGQKDARKLAALSQLIGPFLLRRTRAVVLEELPPREEIVEYIDLDAAETKRYAALRRACELEFQGGEEAGGAKRAQLKIALLAALTRLRQLACDVSLVDPTFTGPSSKLARATDLVSQIVEQKSRVLVFSQFTSLLKRAQKAFVAAGLKVAYLAGDTPTLQRQKIVDAFQAGEFDVFCISLKAGGTGLNLTRASYVLHLDPWWNPAVEDQATARAHRMGQTEPVTVYKLVSRGTIEEAILEMHTVKKDLVDAVLEGRSTSKTLGPNELLSLLRFGDDPADAESA